VRNLPQLVDDAVAEFALEDVEARDGDGFSW